eukprot:9476479-Pyramimonas_sp.AAC.3
MANKAHMHCMPPPHPTILQVVVTFLMKPQGEQSRHRRSCMHRVPLMMSAEGDRAQSRIRRVGNYCISSGQVGGLGFTLGFCACCTGDVHGWRCRVKLAVRGSPTKPLIGLFERNSHRVLPIPNCRYRHSPSNHGTIALT